jgi:hypothetical protein
MKLPSVIVICIISFLAGAVLVGGFLQPVKAHAEKKTEADCIASVIESERLANANEICTYLPQSQRDDAMVKVGTYLVRVTQNG